MEAFFTFSCDFLRNLIRFCKKGRMDSLSRTQVWKIWSNICVGINNRGLDEAGIRFTRNVLRIGTGKEQKYGT